jgi:hypothetical protein
LSRTYFLLGEALGHSTTGLLFARALDPSMNTPVPFSYACKQMLFAIFPSSGGKNTIVVSLVVSHGPWLALLVCCCVVIAWGFIFEKYIRGRYINTSSSVLNVDKPASLTLVRSRSESDLLLSTENRYPATGDWRVNSTLSTDLEMGNEMTSQKVLEEENHDTLEQVLEFDEHDSHKELLPQDSIPLLSSTPSQTKSVNVSPQINISTPAFRMNSVSGMISPNHFSTIMSWIAPEFQHSLFQLSLLYTLQRDGASLATLLSCSSHSISHPTSPHHGTEDIFHSNLTAATLASSHQSVATAATSHHQIILLIEDSWGYVFGAYLAHPLKVSPEYYGNGENFVFALLPQPTQYGWTGRNEYFILSNYHQIIIGGGNGYSIQLDDELNTGVSNTSDTYKNPVLSSNEYFKCLNVEVWAIESSIK